MCLEKWLKASRVRNVNLCLVKRRYVFLICVVVNEPYTFQIASERF